MKKASIFLLGFTLVSTTASAIYHGQQIPESRHPAVKKLRIGASGTCTGTLVGPRTVITAAHCVEPAIETSFWGKKKLKLEVDGVKADGYRMHPKYESNAQDKLAYDVAVVRLSKDFPSTIRLATRGVTEGDPVTLVGYGMTHSDSPSTVGIKREGSNRVHEVMWGQILIRASSHDPSESVPKGGDSGGPLINALGELAGVTSRQLKDTPGQETHLGSYIDVTEPAIAEFFRKAFADLKVAVPQ